MYLVECFKVWIFPVDLCHGSRSAGSGGHSVYSPVCAGKKSIPIFSHKFVRLRATVEIATLTIWRY